MAHPRRSPDPQRNATLVAWQAEQFAGRWLEPVPVAPAFQGSRWVPVTLEELDQPAPVPLSGGSHWELVDASEELDPEPPLRWGI